MTVFWDVNPAALEHYRFALGDDVTVVPHGARVMRELEEGAHHLVVIGPDVDPRSACELAEHVRVTQPAVGVILLRHRLDVAVLADALRSGIREVVQADEQTTLADAVRRSQALSAQLRGGPGGGANGKLITVFSAKGGVGKTTLSVNIASYLASTGARTLLVDLDLMFGDVAISLQLLPTTSLMDLTAMQGHLDAQGLESVVTRHQPTGLAVLAAPADPADAERIPIAVVVELLATARLTYDYVVVDTPPAMTEPVLAALDVSDLTVLIATLDIPAVKNLRITMNTLDALGSPIENRTVVLNRADMKVGLTAKEVEVALRHSLTAELPNHLSVAAAGNRGIALSVAEPKNVFASALRQLVDREVRVRFGERVATGPRHASTSSRRRR